MTDPAAWPAIIAAAGLGFIIGSIPVGHLLWGWLGRAELRRLPGYMVGVPALLQHAGPRQAALVSLADVLKGMAAVLAASALPFVPPWWAAAAVPGVVAGHLFPLLARWLIPDPLPRSRGAFTTLGALLGLSLGAGLSWWVPVISVAVWLVTVLTPYLLGRGHGYTALGNVAAAVTAPVAAWFLGHRGPFISPLVITAILLVWRHKANLARMVEGQELGAAQSRPLPGSQDEVTCAFLVHRMSQDDWWQMRLFAWLKPWAEAGRVPLGWLEGLALRLRPMHFDEIQGIVTPDGRRVRVIILGIPLSAQQILDHPDLAVRRAIAAARLAEEMGARAFGLGAYWSIVGDKGQRVQEAVSIPVTNGGAYTAATVQTGLQEALALMESRGQNPEECTAAVVGAGGVVGFGMARNLAGNVRRLIMVGRNAERLERMAGRLAKRHPETIIETTTDLDALREADIIFSATSQPDSVIFPRHVAPNAIIFDLGRPADVDASVAEEVPGVQVIPGGVVKPPGEMHNRLDLHFGDGLIPACLAETIILAVTGRYEHRSLGERTSTASIAFFAEESRRLGFRVIDGNTDSPTPPTGEPALA